EIGPLLARSLDVNRPARMSEARAKTGFGSPGFWLSIGFPVSNLMKVVILCGGLGTRLREETEFRPKPMVPVGGRPILWHIMKLYASHGHKEIILCLGS